MNSLTIGSRGTYVYYAQTALKRAGFYNGAIDGIFGNETLRAVRAFQSSKGLAADGIIGKNTWNALNVYLKGYITHRVKSGDSLWSIAEMHGASLNAVLTANPLADALNLRIGSYVTVPLPFSVVPTDVPYSYKLLQLIREGLLARYPYISGGSAGRSITGKNLYFFKIGTGATEVFYNAAHHANEWITTPVLLKYLEEYAYRYSVGGEVYGTAARELFKKASLYIMPMVNPDGVDLVNGTLDNSYFLAEAKRYAANYPLIPYPNGWKANINGVDLNLQYPARWETAREIKYSQGFTKPGPRDFVGYTVLSQPESKAVYDFTNRHDFRLTLSYHSQGEIIYWKYLDYEPARSREIAMYFGEVSGYSVEETPYASGFAGYKDWFIEAYDRPGYTIEVGAGQSPLPLSQFERIYNANIGILTGGITQI